MNDPASLVALPAPGPGVSVYEPHAAIDRANPDRLAVAAMYGNAGARGGRSLYLWQSEDRGATWRGDRVVQARYDGEGAADPLVAFGADGTPLVAGMMVPRAAADGMEARCFNRASMPAFDELMASLAGEIEAGGFDREDIMFVTRVGGGGSSFDSIPIAGSQGADKPAVAVDTYPDSPFAGSVYVAWQDMGAGNGHVQVARSVDDGGSFAPPVRVVEGPGWGPSMAQLAVRPDGSLHVVWTVGIVANEDAPPAASTSLWHAFSVDGGVTFSEARPIAEHAGLALIGLPALGVDPDGRMLLVWGQGTAAPESPLSQVRHHLFAMRSADGLAWTEPAPVMPDMPASTSMGLPAVAGHGDNWWILTYLADDSGTEVAILHSEDGGHSFKRGATLAHRPIAVDDIYLHGGYLLRCCEDVFQAGDYVGLAAAASQVVAAFVLPETDDPQSPATAYVAVLRDG